MLHENYPNHTTHVQDKKITKKINHNQKNDRKTRYGIYNTTVTQLLGFDFFWFCCLTVFYCLYFFSSVTPTSTTSSPSNSFGLSNTVVAEKGKSKHKTKQVKTIN